MIKYKITRTILGIVLIKSPPFKYPTLILYSLMIFIFTFQSLYSQTPPYYHYTSSDGLPSSTVFDMLQDKEGFMWFGTLNGLSRFDGKHFINFNEKDGLNSVVITTLLHGINGEIYIGNYEKGINILRNGKIENFRSKIKGTNFNTSFFLRQDNKIYSYSSYGRIVFFNENTDSSKDGFIVVHPATFIIRLARLSNGNILVLTSKGIFRIENNKLIKMNINGLPDGYYYCLAERSDGSYFVGAKGAVYQINNNSVINKFVMNSYANKLIYSIYCDKKNNIWFSILGKGFFLIPSGSNKILNLGEKMGLENTQIDGFYEDKEENIWISTFGKGVFCLNNLYLRNYSEKDGLTNNNVNCIEKEKSGKILFGTINGINILDNGIISPLKNKSGKILTGYINDIKSYDKNIYINWASETPEIKSVSYKDLNFHFVNFPSFYKTRSGLYIYGNVGNDIRILNEYKTKFKGTIPITIFGDSLSTNRINAIVEDSKNNIWIGTSLGLCKLSEINIKTTPIKFTKTFFPDNPVLSSKINSIYTDKKNRVWFTGVKGIACYDLETDSIANNLSIIDLDNSLPTSVAIDSKQRIWIGTMKGLYLLDNGKTKFLNRNEGLPSNEILSLYFDDEKNSLYIGTSDGISLLDMTSFDSYVNPKLTVQMLNIKAGDSVYTNYSNLVFNPEQHDIFINYKTISYSSPGSIKYKYKLNDDPWIETENDFLNFLALKHGDYKLQIKAKTQNADWSKTYFLSFRILPRFIETIWFEILLISVLVSLFVLIIIWRLKLNNKKIRLELELTEKINNLKHQALSAMMNPHFIFNSLNSVQFLINSKKNEEANNYIAMMAKLIRKNLDTAGNGFILLSEEINRLKLYLDLEKLRFQERFSYEIILGEDVKPDSLLIPNMIIQPFVENSLWHGIINSGNNGLLTISFLFENIEIDSIISKSLIIKVTDNGVGIKQAKQNRREDHISKGIQIIEERLKLLSTKMELPKPIILEDLSERYVNSHGTEVIISLSSPMYKDISIN
ncbi:ligand-binding sensor domain-containing protein [Rosettibacter firmus]|uniref:ligand-binding sensor domain-containing protein n=1 Tax=Rosettibacter firmus TaxID=3111522 RepID=UPI00336C1B37